MKIFADSKPYDCKKCLFGLSKEVCTLLQKQLSEDSYGYIEPLNDCPIISIEDIQIKTEIERQGYSDDMLKISLLLDDEEISSDKFIYKRYHGSEDD